MLSATFTLQSTNCLFEASARAPRSALEAFEVGATANCESF
jgi:hypothetical protein